MRDLIKRLESVNAEHPKWLTFVSVLAVVLIVALSLTGCSDDNHFTTEVTSDRPPCAKHEAVPSCDDGTIVTPSCQDHCPVKDCAGRCEMEVCSGAEWVCPCTGRNCFEVTPAPKEE